MKITCNKANPPLGGFLAIELYRSLSKSIDVAWGSESTVTLPNSKKPVTYGTSNDLIRLLENAFNKSAGPLQKVTMNHWLSFSLILEDEMPKSVEYLDKTLSPLTYLVGESLSVSDLAVFSVLHVSNKFKDISKATPPKNILRWMKLIQAQPPIVKALKELPEDVQQNISKASSRRSPAAGEAGAGRLQEGKFIDLPHAEMGKVIVRFPPEASGYLHIGHAKAALLNQYYQQAFQGKLIMRFDDTNPAKENAEFEKVILGDVEMLEIKPDLFTHTSQYFDLMLQYCEQLIKEGKAFVDDTPAEQMKAERDSKTESRNRNNSVAKNLQLWEEMKKASDSGVRCCVRAKIDMASANGCMRDPTIYRCKPEVHPRTGSQYKVYPTYDFACPIVDSIEGVTHVLRTMEYHDRDPQFYWFIDALGLRKPYIWEYSRLSMTNTVLSKRKLTWFVEQGLVDGWDDPRMPTVRGVLRRGMTVEALRQFIRAQGSSRSVVFMEWDKIWAINKKVIDPIAPRYTTIETTPVPVNLKGVNESTLTVPLHPKNENIGTKEVWVAPRLLIDQSDAKLLKEGENTTFIYYGNVMIDKIHKSADGTITSIDGTPNLDNKDFKKTVKVTWLADTAKSPAVETYCVYFDHIISKPLLGKDEDFKQYIGHQTRWEIPMLGEPALASVKQGDIIQIQRRGFFRVDAAPSPPSPQSGRPAPLVLFHVPDGHAKELPGQPKPATAATPAAKPASSAAPAAAAAASSAAELHARVAKQGEAVRALKAAKAEKAAVDAAVKSLLELKAQYKAATGQDWKPDAPPAAPAAPAVTGGAADAVGAVLARIAAQGDTVRQAKAQKKDKTTVDAEVKVLLSLKAEYKTLTGKDWTPNAAAPAPTAAPAVAPAATAGFSAAALDLNKKITEQGNRVRTLKEQKADKAAVQAEVQSLLALKAEFKKAAGKDWAPNLIQEQSSAAPVPAPAPTSTAGFSATALDLNKKITEQGNRVRTLKEQKADKAAVQAEVQSLLSLKAEFKKEAGKDWAPNLIPEQPSSTPAAAPAPTAAAGFSAAALDLNKKIAEQGNKVRTLKEQKADKAAVQAEVQSLLALKAEFKKEAGKDWAPNLIQEQPSATPAPAMDGGKEQALAAEVARQGDLVRDLKTKKADKATIDAAVKTLLELKAKYQAETGKAYAPPSQPRDSKPKEQAKPKEAKPKEAKPKEAKPKEKKAKEASPKPASEEGASSTGLKKVTRLGLEAKKDSDLPEWYSQVITKSEMIEYYDISGCYILRPWSFAIWELIREFLSQKIKALGVKDCSFPMFVSKSALEREKTHIADFAPEVAWVTHSGSSELGEHIAVRPTSETVMYPAYAKWVQSHRDLPLKLNQWNSVVRWEFKQPQPFLRTREFLWQEGHTAYMHQQEAVDEVHTILDYYAQVYEHLLAIPVIKGRKTEKEKFAGGDFTTTVEGYIPASGRAIQEGLKYLAAVPVIKGRKTEKEKFAGGDFTTTVEGYIPASGRAIQGATSHHLGQNFSKMFEIIYDDPDTQEKKYVFQNSWGITTRTIGVMVLVHGDDRGLVLPPRVAAAQAVVVPCGVTASSTPQERQTLLDACKQLVDELCAAGIRAEGDYRDNYSPGWKFNHWELKGVPVRVELGPKDLAAGTILAVRRLTGEKLTLQRASAPAAVAALLERTHDEMLARATAERDARLSLVTQWEQFTEALERKHMLLAPFCGEIPCEDNIKNDSARTEDDQTTDVRAPSMGAKSLCIPFKQPRDLTAADKCIHPACANKPKFFTLFGRSY